MNKVSTLRPSFACTIDRTLFISEIHFLKQFQFISCSKMTLSNEDGTQNAVKDPKYSNIFDSHYYKLYKLMHTLNGSWPSLKFYYKFIATANEWSGGSIIVVGQVRCFKLVKRNTKQTDIFCRKLKLFRQVQYLYNHRMDFESFPANLQYALISLGVLLFRLHLLFYSKQVMKIRSFH